MNFLLNTFRKENMFFLEIGHTLLDYFFGRKNKKREMLVWEIFRCFMHD